MNFKLFQDLNSVIYKDALVVQMFYITPYDFCQWNLNSGFQYLAGFRIHNAEFRIPKPQAKTFPVPDSGLH